MGEQNKINTENPKTKTDYEMRDFSWNNIIGWGIVVLLIGVGMEIYKKNK
jgi:hypothetical protein